MSYYQVEEGPAEARDISADFQLYTPDRLRRTGERSDGSAVGPQTPASSGRRGPVRPVRSCPLRAVLGLWQPLGRAARPPGPLALRLRSPGLHAALMRVRRGLLRGPAPRPLPRSGHRGRTRGRRWGPGRLAPRRGHSRPTLPPSVCGPLAARKLFSVCGPARPSVAGPFSALRGSGPQPPFGGPGPVAPPAGGRPALPRFGSGPPGPCPRTPGARGGAPPPAAGGAPPPVRLCGLGLLPRSCCLAAGLPPAGVPPAGVSPPPVPLRGRRKARRGPVPSGAAWPGF